ncbi:TRAP transporter substrate-binding protein [Pararhodospirillum oryzae]|uniref:C4-dicarboxylate ABC transporter n=1 Tax=Pararhodospirillum oryzae TaxID=478448 RepID=A0A512HA35_9PROT|nr:TRAP transporter substrate-binding protein [Pararhodospirillum oryzae]GEO82250.1 C4-dicarboxylate ABC transporter [Pararhodospirillum oryzae]
MKRRDFLTTAATGGGAAAAAASLAATAALAPLAAPAVAKDRVEWKMVTPWPRNSPGVGINAQRFADMVTAMSDGRLTITLYSAGELVPPFEVLDAVQSDLAQVGHAASYYWQGKAPALNLFTSMPFGLMAWELDAWLACGDGQALWEETYAPFGVLPFYAGNSGVQAGGWFNKEINTVEDIKGLKMRIAGLGAEVMRRLGAATVLTPPGEIMPALMSGAVDAAEWVSPWLDIAFGLQKAARYYYMPAFHEPGPSLEILVNKARYEILTDDLKAIVRAAAQAVAGRTLADFTYNNTMVFAEMAEKYPSIEIRTFSDDVIRALGAMTRTVLEDMAARDPMTAKVYASMRAFTERCVRYQDHADLPALRQRKLALGL